MSATRTTLIAALVLVLTFAGGFLAGAFTHRALAMRMHHPAPAVTHMILEHLDRRLDLTDAQRAQIARILQRRHARLLAELESVNAEIERVLTPEQRARFARMRMRMHGRP